MLDPDRFDISGGVFRYNRLYIRNTVCTLSTNVNKIQSKLSIHLLFFAKYQQEIHPQTYLKVNLNEKLGISAARLIENDFGYNLRVCFD